MYTFVLKITQIIVFRLRQIFKVYDVDLVSLFLFQMVAFSYLHSPPSRDGEELGLSFSGPIQLFDMNIIACWVKSVLDQEMIAETKTTVKIF